MIWRKRSSIHLLWMLSAWKKMNKLLLFLGYSELSEWTAHMSFELKNRLFLWDLWYSERFNEHFQTAPFRIRRKLFSRRSIHLTNFMACYWTNSVPENESTFREFGIGHNLNISIISRFHFFFVSFIELPTYLYDFFFALNEYWWPCCFFSIQLETFLRPR